MKQSSNEIILTPSSLQFVINELPLLFLLLGSLVFGGMEISRFSRYALFFSIALALVLLYRYIYLKRIKYHIGEEQLICEQGIIQRSVNYMELYRIVDFSEQQSLMQQLFGLKSVTILSMDRNTPKLTLQGIRLRYDIISVIRKGVEQNKRNKGIYEITNH